MSSARKYESLGSEVRKQIGDGPGPEQRERIRTSFSDMTVAMRHRPRRVWRLAAAAACVLCVALVTYGLLEALVPEPLAFWVGDETRPGEQGAWLQASADAPLPVRFEDGTRVELRGNSTGRVASAYKKKVRIELERGKLEARVNKQKTRTNWAVQAGPYRVTVVGTVFSVAWKADPNSLDVQVHLGRVLVRGPGLDPGGEKIGAGERLVLRGEGDGIVKHREEATGTTAQIEKVETGGPKGIEEVEEAVRVAMHTTAVEPPTIPEPVRDEPPPEGTKVAGLADHRPGSWQELYEMRKYAEALEVASKEGFDGLIQAIDDRELWQLADAARYAGRGAEAKQALIALRSRFHQSWRAPIAAFLLGRVAIENQEDPRSACNWFQIYLHEDPNGRLAEEALGRSIDACFEAGMHAKAVKAARDYREKYPQGAFLKAAEAMLEAGGVTKP